MNLIDAYQRITGERDEAAAEAALICYCATSRVADLCFDELDFVGRNFVIKFLLKSYERKKIVAQIALLNSINYKDLLRSLEGEEIVFSNGWWFYVEE